jgi:hypothetical protein
MQGGPALGQFQAVGLSATRDSTCWKFGRCSNSSTDNRSQPMPVEHVSDGVVFAHSRVALASPLAGMSCIKDPAPVLRIETESDETSTTIRLIGRVRSGDLDELKRHIQSVNHCNALDLSEVTLVDLDVIRFLIACEDAEMALRHCSLYVQEWIHRERVEGNKA